MALGQNKIVKELKKTVFDWKCFYICE